jgi:molecular chaperone GrpE
MQTKNDKKNEKNPGSCMPKLSEKDKKIEELTDTLKRLQAEFDNYQKRDKKEKAEFIRYIHADMTNHLLPIIDSFQLALKSNENTKKFFEGIKLIYTQLYSLLESQGMRPIKSVGEKFDPYRHEVLLKEKSDKEEGTILEEFQTGYMFKDKVLRYSKVKVSENKEINNKEESKSGN